MKQNIMAMSLIGVVTDIALTNAFLCFPGTVHLATYNIIIIGFLYISCQNQATTLTNIFYHITESISFMESLIW